MITIILVLAACAFLNRLAGDSWSSIIPMSKLPGRPLWYVAPAIGVVALLAASSAVHAAALAGAFLIWRLLEWGRWIDIDTMPDDWNREGVEPTWLERLIGRLPGAEKDAVALTYRHAIAVPPLWFAVGPFALAFPFLATAGYVVAHKVQPRSNHIPLAELLVGLVWGAAILIA